MNFHFVKNYLICCCVPAIISLGCGGSNAENDVSADSDTNDSDQMALTGELELATWWTSTGEVEALEALLNVYSERHPGVTTIDIMADQTTSPDMTAVVRERMAAGTPPDTFQVVPAFFEEWVNYTGGVSVIEPLDDLFASEGWLQLYPQEILDSLQLDGHYYAVPLNIHRLNTLYCHQGHIPNVPTTMAEFMDIARQLHANGVTPLALSIERNGWWLDWVFNSFLAGTGGIDFYNQFVHGQLDLNEAENRAILETAVDYLIEIISYTNENAQSVDMYGAADLLPTGEAAMYLIGDWMTTYYKNMGWTAGVTPSPGTDGMYMYTVDAFVLASDAPNHANAVEFLKVVGSPEGQSAFNLLKGGVPVHPLADVSDWPTAAAAPVAQFRGARLRLNVHTLQTKWSPNYANGVNLYALATGALSRDDFVNWKIEQYQVATE